MPVVVAQADSQTAEDIVEVVDSTVEFDLIQNELRIISDLNSFRTRRIATRDVSNRL